MMKRFASASITISSSTSSTMSAGTADSAGASFVGGCGEVSSGCELGESTNDRRMKLSNRDLKNRAFPLRSIASSSSPPDSCRPGERALAVSSWYNVPSSPNVCMPARMSRSTTRRIRRMSASEQPTVAGCNTLLKNSSLSAVVCCAVHCCMSAGASVPSSQSANSASSSGRTDRSMAAATRRRRGRPLERSIVQRVKQVSVGKTPMKRHMNHGVPI
mmetsp:Transcript_22149/g.52632  ORF Transcript_22149/g.52632 Transcript_22149/m.52632 type:complete len:217 (-) Transcript_22149:341-991(-)